MYVRNPLAPVVMSIPPLVPATVPLRACACEWMAGWLAGWLAGCSAARGATRTLTDTVYDVTYRVRTKQGRGGDGSIISPLLHYVHPLAGWLRQRQRANSTRVSQNRPEAHSLARPPPPCSILLFSFCRPESLQNIDIRGGQSYIYTYPHVCGRNKLTLSLNHLSYITRHQDQGQQKCELETKSAALPGQVSELSRDNRRAAAAGLPFPLFPRSAQNPTLFVVSAKQLALFPFAHDASE